MHFIVTRRGCDVGSTVAREDGAVSSPQVRLHGEETRVSVGSEFKAFALKGNVVDLAVGVIIGAAFGKIVDSVVNDLIMPVVGRIFGGLDFANYFLPLKEVPPRT